VWFPSLESVLKVPVSTSELLSCDRKDRYTLPMSTGRVDHVNTGVQNDAHVRRL